MEVRTTALDKAQFFHCEESVNFSFFMVSFGSGMFNNGRSGKNKMIEKTEEDSYEGK
jgi:hypothetical protein